MLNTRGYVSLDPYNMHNCRSTHQQRLQKDEITRNRSDNESLSFLSITSYDSNPQPSHDTENDR